MSCDGATGYSMVASPFTMAVGGQRQETFYAQWSSGGQYDYTSQMTWSSSNPGVATVQAGLGHGVSAGSVTFSASDHYIADYTPYQCYSANMSCPIAQGGGGTGPGTTQVPTYLGPNSAESTDGGCATGAVGPRRQRDAREWSYPSRTQIANGTPKPGYQSFSTPTSTIVDGKFDDDPFGSCFGPPKPSTNTCVSVTVYYQAIYNGTTYPIQTTSSRRDRNNGSKITVSGNPAAYNKTFTQGTIN